ncbi:MAG: radical SAM protein [Candidatus Pacearchaeota archaeon]|jgi:hypothetical protein
MKTPYDSYILNELPKGCQLCVKGEKSVLFVSGVCSRKCFYCSLSKKRKNKNLIFVNERKISEKNIKALIEEIKQSNSKGIGITGGDPLLYLNRTIAFAKALKKEFKEFHIHIYLPTKLVTKQKLKSLSRYIDEVRFHPEFLLNLSEQTEKEKQKDIDKIKIASLFWKKQDIGCELPLLPDKKQETLEFIKNISPFVGFVNLNEFEISDTNFKEVIKKYNLNSDTYTIAHSKESGIWIIEQLSKLESKLDINVHLCTANTKNLYQFKNRLKLHDILPYGKKTDDGTVIYLATYTNTIKELNSLTKELKNQNIVDFYIDKKKKRILLSPQIVPILIKQNKYKIERVEEFPTFDSIETERETI